jgi:hypothetical protein
MPVADRLLSTGLSGMGKGKFPLKKITASKKYSVLSLFNSNLVNIAHSGDDYTALTHSSLVALSSPMSNF